MQTVLFQQNFKSKQRNCTDILEGPVKKFQGRRFLESESRKIIYLFIYLQRIRLLLQTV